ncbi:hypothetical protein H5410_056848 [Solanum commersonii]|uniref:Uncharacterized protein n=1 Tax=Solanum commersonii TaxID=4109 RepID=A0A9J5WMG0_SOLCO|nr:hypothetical protein H5410_056848 [Solanum commersonii]
MHLVRIVDTFGDPPFGLALGNCSTICRLLPFLVDLISSFEAQHIGTLGEVGGISCYTRVNHECTQKTQLTHARINSVLKDSSCDTPLSNILKLTILASNASSRSTKEFRFPHTKE